MRNFKWKIKKIFWLLSSLMILAGAAAWHLHRYPAYLRPIDRIIIVRWLLHHPGYRLARPVDCGNCGSQINELRDIHDAPEYLIPGFTPYYARGDFNQDGKMDFAVAVIDETAEESTFIVLIFNGSLKAMGSTPAFASDGLELRGGGLFFFPQRATHDKVLLAGPFNSDSTVHFAPEGDTYVPVYEEEEEENDEEEAPAKA